MFQIDTLLAFAIGLSYAHAARDALRYEPDRLGNRYLVASNLAHGLFFVPWGIYYFTGWPSWESLYWFEFTDTLYGRPFESLLVPVFAMSLVIALNGGFLLGQGMIARDLDRWVNRLRWASLAGVVAILGFNTEAILWVGTTRAYRQPHHEGAAPLLQSAFLPYFIGSVLFFSVALIAVGIWMRKATALPALRVPFPAEGASGQDRHPEPPSSHVSPI